MKLYKLSQTINNDYDTYDSAIVAAEDEEQARKMKIGETGKYGSWVLPKFVTVEYIGEAREGMNAGIILASFNAG